MIDPDDLDDSNDPDDPDNCHRNPLYNNQQLSPRILKPDVRTLFCVAA